MRTAFVRAKDALKKPKGHFQMQKDQAEEVVWSRCYEEVELVQNLRHVLSNFQFEAACFLPTWWTL